MKRSAPVHWPQEGQIANTNAGTPPPAKKALLRRTIERLLNAGGSGSTSNSPAPGISGSDGAARVAGRAATYTGHFQFSQEALGEFHEGFALFEQNGDREISPNHPALVMRTTGETLTMTELEEMIAKADNNGSLTLLTEEELRSMFKEFDQDGKGFITAPDLRYAMTALGVQVTDEEVAEM
ncbi:hypothetical protein MTO96_025553, partial [Rhipicephalus appendiculatus]